MSQNNNLSPRDLEQIRSNAKAHSQAIHIYNSKIKKDQKKLSFKKTMQSIRSEMPLLNRVYSYFIHTPIINNTLEFTGKTILRPNSIFIGSIFAFLGTSICYFFAKKYGYILSNIEVVLFFVVGWLIGLSYDLLRLMSGK